jgi:hypothetical protein
MEDMRCFDQTGWRREIECSAAVGAVQQAQKLRKWNGSTSKGGTVTAKNVQQKADAIFGLRIRVLVVRVVLNQKPSRDRELASL